MLTDSFITLAICIICQFAALLPLVTSLAILHCDVLEPQPGVTTVKAVCSWLWVFRTGIQRIFPLLSIG